MGLDGQTDINCTGPEQVCVVLQKTDGQERKSIMSVNTNTIMSSNCNNIVINTVTFTLNRLSHYMITYQ